MGFGVWGLGFEVCGLWFRISGFGVWGLDSGVKDFGFRVTVQGLGLRV